ncbi:sugar phosphate isomerase/epimerase family protein [Streptomyces sp. HNM0574]|uniref:sugar phosphate isomerase/epimerase family protein n=1 Tax=Streptomyces sp. HNM0574 TaxID=2714954 RepID=UPI00146BBC7F|nr:sugar phosphate isomerase/epimerase family protein [Streptomyces sp. HNM0574]NLU68138.1 sugar phosphate isomerase/epimerase [Streptomyces sp. HNM0574]
MSGTETSARTFAVIGDEAAAGLEGQIRTVRRLGWHTLELRTVDGTPLAELPRARARECAARLADAGVDVVCLASRIGNWGRPVTGDFAEDVTELDTLIEQGRLFGCGMVRVMSYPNDGLPEAEWARHVTARLTRLAARAEEAGVTLVHENCSGWAGASAPRTLRLLEDVASPALRVLFDIGNGVPHGYDGVAMLRELLPHVAHVHVKDAVRTSGDDTAYTLPGDGQAHVAECLDMLARGGYTGALSLEPHLAVRPHEGLNRPGADATSLTVSAGERLERLWSQTLDALAGRPA